MTTPSSLQTDAVDAFERAHGVLPTRVQFAPGRVNLLGAHLDYSGGMVLPVAVGRGVLVAISETDDGIVDLRSLSLPGDFRVRMEDIGVVARGEHSWARYPLGAIRAFMQETGRRPRGLRAVFASDLPIGAGMSSSAAIQVATLGALNAMWDTGLGDEQIARAAHKAETEYVLVQCGIMDQFASALGRADHALLLRCDDASYEHVPLASDALEVVVVDTKKSRELAGSAFNDRVRECGESFEILCREVGARDVLARFAPEEVEGAADALGPIRTMRARHVTTEMQRIRAGVEALRQGDLHGFGAQVTASHWSTAGDYAVSCHELDLIVEQAVTIDGVYGARLTGAGFGGCAIVLAKPGLDQQIREIVGGEFRRRFGVEPGVLVVRPGDGPRGSNL